MIAALICAVLNPIGDVYTILRVRKQISRLCRYFPLHVELRLSLSKH